MMRGRRSKSGPSPQLETKSRGPSDVWGEKRCVLSSPRQSPASARGVCTATAGCRGRVGAHAHGAHSGCWALRSFSRRVSALACFFIHPASPSQAFPNGLEAEAQIPPSAEGPLSPVSPHSREPWGDSWRDSKEKNLTSGHRTDFLSSHFFYGGKILPSQPCLMCNPVVLSTFPLLGNPHHNHLQNSVPPAKPKLRPHPAPPPRPAAPGSRRPPPPPSLRVRPHWVPLWSGVTRVLGLARFTERNTQKPHPRRSLCRDPFLSGAERCPLQARPHLLSHSSATASVWLLRVMPLRTNVDGVRPPPRDSALRALGSASGVGLLDHAVILIF